MRAHGYPRATSHPNPVPLELFVDAYVIETTTQEIDRAVSQGRAPFFAFCSLLSPHGPVDPPGHWAEVYRDRPLPPINYRKGEIHDHPLHERRLVGLLEGESSPWTQREHYFPSGHPNVREIDAHRRLYYGLASYCDAQIGRLLHHLDDTGLRENTLVIFTSDHGTTLFDHGFYDKHCYYDCVWRVPLIMSMPGTLPQGGTREFAVWTDLTATILGAADLESPAIQGFDLFHPLAKGEPSPRSCAVGTLYKSCALAIKRWKLAYYFEEGRGQLFDRLSDPEEQIDLYDHARYRSVREELVSALLTWRCGLEAVEDLIGRTTAGPTSGGPVARRIAHHTRALVGRDMEQWLNERIQGIDGIAT